MRYALGVTLVQVLWIARLVMPVSWAWPTFIAFMALELAVPVWAERPGMTPWHPHHIAERYGLLVIITLGECVLGATNSVAGIYQSQGWSLELALVGLGATSLVFSLWWMYFLQPMGDALHHHRDRAFLWGYGHFVVFASAAAVGASLEVVADVLKAEGAAGAGDVLGEHDFAEIRSRSAGKPGGDGAALPAADCGGAHTGLNQFRRVRP